MSKKIIVTLTDEEGAIHVDALTGTIETPQEELPAWAAGLAVASLAERVGWYEQRMGSHLPEDLRSPEIINFHDLSWIGVDEAGDEVHVDFSAQYRMDKLAELLDIDVSPEAFDNMENSVMIDHTYAEAPTSETTLAEAEGQTFTAVEQEAKHG